MRNPGKGFGYCRSLMELWNTIPTRLSSGVHTRLDELYLEYPFFGSRRMAVTLEVNRKRIQRLIRILSIEALYPKPNLSRPALGHEIYPYLLRDVFIERLWRSLKYELIYPGDFASGADLFQALDCYFRFYNHRRPHQALSYRTPADLFPHRSIRKRSSP